MKNLVFCIACLSWVRGWVGGWVGVRPPPPPGGGGGVGHLSVCGYAKILGGWVPELTPPPLGWLSKTLGWPSRSTRPSFAEAYLGATPVVGDSLLRSAPFVASAARLALIAASILRCRGTPRPVALGPTPLPKGTTSMGGGRCPGEPHARSHSGPMHIGENVQEPIPLPTSHVQCPEQASKASTPLRAAAAWV